MTSDEISFLLTLLLLALGAVVVLLVIIILTNLWEEYGHTKDQNQNG